MSGKEKAVVIGAGMGGLAAAIRLSALGLSVTVVDMAEGPGGKARAVPSAAGPVDTGPTVMTLPDVADSLFRLCGTRLEAEVDLIPLPRLARHFWPSSAPLDLYPDPEANFEAIRALCGLREAEAFRRFDRLSRRLHAAFDAPVMRAPRPMLGPVAAAALRQPGIWPALLPGMTLDRLLRRHFRDPRLVQLFGRYATYVGGRPTHSPAVLSLIWSVEAQGVFAVRQGMHGLAAALARVAARQGVEFRFATRARRIVRQGGHVTGVEVEGGATLPCAICVFNGDPATLAEGRLGDAVTPAKARPAKRSLSAWVWAFAARPHGVELAHHNVFFTADPAQEFGPIGHGEMPLAPSLYVCAQDRELGSPLPELERFEIIMNGPAGHPPPTEEEATCRIRTFPALRAQGLTFSPPPEAAALTTPQALARRYPGSGGAIYGVSPEGALAAFHRPTARTALPGLYLAGGGAHPGAGVPMALISGQHAATAVAEDRARRQQAIVPPTPAQATAPTSASASDRAAMPGGMSTPSQPTGRKPSA
jgi:1-hydroxycarotenoid 3,4-desaturase